MIFETDSYYKLYLQYLTLIFYGKLKRLFFPSPLLLTPTSNLDSLNEAEILKALTEGGKEKTIVLVSHRRSTLNIADTIYSMNQSRIS